MNIAEQFEKRKEQLRSELRLLEENNLQALFEERTDLESKLVNVNQKITNACTILGIDQPGVGKTKGVRMKKGELLTRILSLLGENPGGLSQKDISVKTQGAYPSVVVCLKQNQEKFRSTGERKAKRFFLK